MIKKVLLIGGGEFSLGSVANGELIAAGHLDALRTLNCNVSIDVFDPFIEPNVVENIPGVIMIDDLETALRLKSYHVVSIVTPNNTHLSVLKRILTTGERITNILIEKPLCTNLNQLKEIEILIENNKNISFFINHSWAASIMFSPILKNVFEKISVKSIICEYYGGFLNIGSHVFSIITPLLSNGSNSLLYAQKTKFERTAEDANYDFIMQTDFGKIHFISFDEKNFQILNLRVFHTQGVIEILEYGTRIKVWGKEMLSNCTEIKLEIDEIIDPKSTLSKIYQIIFSSGDIQKELKSIELKMVLSNYTNLLAWKEQLDAY